MFIIVRKCYNSNMKTKTKSKSPFQIRNPNESYWNEEEKHKKSNKKIRLLELELRTAVSALKEEETNSKLLRLQLKQTNCAKSQEERGMKTQIEEKSKEIEKVSEAIRSVKLENAELSLKYTESQSLVKGIEISEITTKLQQLESENDLYRERCSELQLTIDNLLYDQANLYAKLKNMTIFHGSVLELSKKKIAKHKKKYAQLTNEYKNVQAEALKTNQQLHSEARESERKYNKLLYKYQKTRSKNKFSVLKEKKIKATLNIHNALSFKFYSILTISTARIKRYAEYRRFISGEIIRFLAKKLSFTRKFSFEALKRNRTEYNNILLGLKYSYRIKTKVIADQTYSKKRTVFKYWRMKTNTVAQKLKSMMKFSIFSKRIMRNQFKAWKAQAILKKRSCSNFRYLAPLLFRVLFPTLAQAFRTLISPITPRPLYKLLRIYTRQTKRYFDKLNTNRVLSIKNEVARKLSLHTRSSMRNYSLTLLQIIVKLRLKTYINAIQDFPLNSIQLALEGFTGLVNSILRSSFDRVFDSDSREYSTFKQ